MFSQNKKNCRIFISSILTNSRPIIGNVDTTKILIADSCIIFNAIW